MSRCPNCRRTYAEGVRFCPADGAELASTDSAASSLGRVLMGQFKLVSIAGSGAMGTVYAADQTTVGRKVAVKVLRPELMQDPHVVQRFLREARAAARLSHPSIVVVHLVGETEEGLPFIVMEYVEGESLHARCERERLLNPAVALGIVRQIALALHEAHTHGIVHRDLKPENILLVEKPNAPSQVKVLDFGIAKILREEGGSTHVLTRDGSIFGTPHYISPEQASGQEVDARADLYSLGVILFRLVTGRLPFEGTSGMDVLVRHINEPPPHPRTIQPELSEPLAELILHALEKPRHDRFQDADEFMAGIDGVMDRLGGDAGRTLLGVAPPPSGRTEPIKAPPPPLSSASPPVAESSECSPEVDPEEDNDENVEEELFGRPRGRRRWWWASVAAITVGIGIGLFYSSHHRPVASSAYPPPDLGTPVTASVALPPTSPIGPPPALEAAPQPKPVPAAGKPNHHRRAFEGTDGELPTTIIPPPPIAPLIPRAIGPAADSTNDPPPALQPEDPYQILDHH